MMKEHWHHKEVKRFYRIITLLLFMAVGWIFLVSYEGGRYGCTICASKLIFHIPCSGCGLSRAAVAILRGNFREGFRLNPNIVVVFPVIILSLLFFLYDVVFRRHKLYAIYRAIGRKKLSPIIIFLLVIIEFFIAFRAYRLGI